MRVHHLNCVSTCPLGGWLMDHRTRDVLARGRLTSHDVGEFERLSGHSAALPAEHLGQTGAPTSFAAAG